MSEKGIRVTITYLKTGETETKELHDGYLLLTTGSCHLAHSQANLKTGTHTLTVKGRYDHA